LLRLRTSKFSISRAQLRVATISVERVELGGGLR